MPHAFTPCSDTTLCMSRLSEQRVHDLLDGLCNDVSKKNMLYTSAEGAQSWAKVAQPGWTAPSKPEEDGERSAHTWQGVSSNTSFLYST